MTRGYSMFSVIERDSGRWVGRIGPWQPEGWPGTEVGWGVDRRFAGKGYAYEAAVAAIDYAVDVLGWTNMIHTIDPDNLASIRLAERLGSTNRGPSALPDPLAHFRVDAWGESADQWRARRTAMTMQPPPPRYRVVEQGRRLVVIDTLTGDLRPSGAKDGATTPVRRL